MSPVILSPAQWLGTSEVALECRNAKLALSDNDDDHDDDDDAVRRLGEGHSFQRSQSNQRRT